MTSYKQTTQEVRDAFDALCKGRVKAAVEAEREACAKVCEDFAATNKRSHADFENAVAIPIQCAVSIRARNNT